MDSNGRALQELAEVVARLRGPDGCPWDREQTHESLIPYLLEEAYEAAEALRAADPEKMKEELGDLLLQIVLHARIEEEEERFSLTDVAEGLRRKLVRRHPHVFGSAEVGDACEVRRRWEDIKRQEGGGPDLTRPALVAARKHLEAGGCAPEAEENDWPSVDGEPEDAEAAIGALLMRVVALARLWGVEPELALRRHLQTLCDA